MAFVYLLGIPAIIILWISWFNAGMNRPSRYAIGTPTRTSSVLVTRQAGYSGFSVAGSATPAPRTAAPINYDSPALSTDRPCRYCRQPSATPSATSTPTLNPFGTMHLTLTALWKQVSATPFAATLMAQPLFDMNTGVCFQNCENITVSPP